MARDAYAPTLLEEFLTRTHKAVTIAQRVAIGDFVVDARIIEATTDAAAWYGVEDPRQLIGQWISLVHHPEDATLGRTLSVARHYGIKVPTCYVSRIRQLNTPHIFRPVLKETTQMTLGNETYWVTILSQPHDLPLAMQMQVWKHLQLPPSADITHFCGYWSVAEMETLLRNHLSLQATLSQFSEKNQSRKSDAEEMISPVGSGQHPRLVLTPGQTYLMPTGRYVHWCAVCGNLWRSGEALPPYCGHRTCHSPHWRTGKRVEEGGA